MGDHRCEIKIDFNAHGKKYTQEWSINYFDNGAGIDQRIVDWFSDCWADAMAKYDKAQAAYWAEQDAKATTDLDLKELERLRKKYPGRTGRC